MTRSKKIITTALVALIPLGAFAHDDERNHDRDEHHESFSNSKFDEQKLQDANYEFEGEVDARPKTLNGTWTISGKKIVVSDDTYIVQESKKIRVGDEVYIIAKREDGKITALSLEQDD